MGKKALEMHKSQVEDLSAQIAANTKVVYIATRDIEAGEPIDDAAGGNVIKQAMMTGLTPDHYITDEDIGCIARVNIPIGQAIYADCVSALEFTNDTREYEMAVAHLMTNQKENDMVDIRIMFPNGEDYTVLSKKKIQNLALDQCIFYTLMNEDEIMRMASAIIDAFTISGTKIYTTRYIESTLQEDAVPNYVVKPEVLDLINSDPNITEIATKTLNLQARIDLEQRLSGLTDDHLNAVVAGHQIEDTASSSVILNNAYEVNNSDTNAYEAYNSENNAAQGTMDDTESPRDSPRDTREAADDNGAEADDDGTEAEDDIRAETPPVETTPPAAENDTIE